MEKCPPQPQITLIKLHEVYCIRAVYLCQGPDLKQMGSFEFEDQWSTYKSSFRSKISNFVSHFYLKLQKKQKLLR